MLLAIVSTAIGDGTPGCVDGVGAKARVAYPYGVCRSNDGGAEAKTIVVADTNNCKIRRFYVAEHRVGPYAGSVRGFVSDQFATSQFTSPFHVCIDPNHRGCYITCDDSTIRYLDSAKDTVTCIAGSSEYGFADGVGADAKFSCVHGVVCTRANIIYAADHNNHRVRAIDIPSRKVTTVIGTGSDEVLPPPKSGAIPPVYHGTTFPIAYPRQLIFDRSPNAKPESVLYLTTTGAILRYEMETRTFSYRISCACCLSFLLSRTGVFAHSLSFCCALLPSPLPPNPQSPKTEEIKTLALKDNKYISPFGIDCTPSGTLIVSCCYSNSIYSIDSLNGQIDLIAGSGKHGFADALPLASSFATPSSLTVIDSDQCVYIADFSTFSVCVVYVFSPAVSLSEIAN